MPARSPLDGLKRKGARGGISVPARTPQRLADIQSLMAQAVMRPLARGDRMQRAWTDGSPASQIAEGFIKPNDRLTSFDRLQIYNQQYWWRLLASFEEDYRGLKAVLGQRRFDKLAAAYLDSRGSTSWTMRNLGKYLEKFLGQHPELTAPYGLLALDLARVEWARVIAFDGPGEPPLTPETIARIRPDRLRLGLQPYLTLLELSHPVDDLLLKLKESEIETGAFSNAVSSEPAPRRFQRIAAPPSPHPIHLAVHRHDYCVYYKRLEPEAYLLLRALSVGTALEEACAQAFAASKNLPEADAAKVQQWFATWMRLGWFCK